MTSFNEVTSSSVDPALPPSSNSRCPLTIVEWILIRFIHTKAYAWFARTIMAWFTFRIYGYPGFDMALYPKIKAAIAANPDEVMAFVGADHQSLSWIMTHMFSGANWGHAGFIRQGKDGEPEIVHVKGEGLLVWPLLQYLKECDNFAVGKLVFKSDVEKAQAKARMAWLINIAPVVQYDYPMTMDQRSLEVVARMIVPNPGETVELYCSEAVFAVGQGLVKQPFNGRMVDGLLVFEPDDVYRGCEILFEG